MDSVLAGAAPEVDAGDGSAVQRVAGRDDLGLAGILRLEIAEELVVILIAVVRLEPRGVCRPGCSG